MAKKKSSFHMGDEFNGSGKKTYLRATQHNTYAPLSQHNVRLTPNFNKFVPVVIGALPIGVETTLEGSDEVIKATGSIANVSQVILEKDEETGNFQMNFSISQRALTTGAYLRNKILPKILEPEDCINKEYITLDLLKEKGWKQIFKYYVRRKDGTESPINEMDEEIDRASRDITEEDVEEINSLFEKYKINSKKRICAFFAMCSAETSNGILLIERADKDVDSTRAALKEWFDQETGYGFTYRGGGVIHLTHDYNYEAFEEWMATEFLGEVDKNITKWGAEYVAKTYPWKAGVFFWDKNNLNNTADDINIENIDANNKIFENLDVNTGWDVFRKRYENSYEYDSFFKEIDEVSKVVVGDYISDDGKWERRKDYVFWIKNFPDI